MWHTMRPYATVYAIYGLKQLPDGNWFALGVLSIERDGVRWMSWKGFRRLRTDPQGNGFGFLFTAAEYSNWRIEPV